MGLSSETTRYRALLEYDGTDYYGFQRQRTGTATVQGEIERVLTELVRHSVSITGAGRTDSGVHGIGQVISFTIDWQHGAHALQRAINANLPKDIAVRELVETEDTFHPRFDALRRGYLYYIYNQTVRSPVHRRYTWHLEQQLNMGRMNEAAEALVGRKDFATFGLPPQGKITERDLYKAEWEERSPYLIFHIEANAFLYRMVRSIVGSLVSVGTGAWSVEAFIAALEACDRNRSAAVAPPQGLYLASVTY